MNESCDIITRDELEAAEAEIERLRGILSSYALQYGTVRDKGHIIADAKKEALREFSHFLIDNADGGFISIGDIPDLVIEFLEERNG